MSRVVRAFWMPFALIFLASVAWAFATPLGGSPDEPAHIIRAAGVAHGQLLPIDTDEEGRGIFEVPAGLADAQEWEDCFAHKPTVDASCQTIAGAQSGTARVYSTAGTYNPLYYGLVGWTSHLTDDPYVMVYSMRLLTAIGASAFAAATMFFLTTVMGLRRAALVAAATITPMVLFLSASVNPNAWEITGGMALLAAILSLGFAPDPPPRTLPAFVTIAISGFVVANLRGVSPLWVAVIGGLGLLAIGGPRLAAMAKRPGMWVTLGVVAVGVMAAAAWSAVAGVFTLAGDFRDKDWSAGRVFDYMVRRTLFEHGYVGLFGWTDTAAPLVAVVIIGGIAFAIGVLAFWLGRGRLIVVTTLAIGAWLLLPALVQVWYSKTAGIIWQGRYTLVMYTAVVIFAAVTAHVRSAHAVVPHPARLAWVVGALVVFAQVYTFLTMQIRYARGSGEIVWYLFADPLWSPPGGAPLWLALTAATTIAFVALVAGRRERAESDPAAAQG